MGQDQLAKLIESGESETIEFKATFDREVIETATAFANTKGGVILIGVSDNGEIEGIQIGKETLRDWVNQISQGTDPRVIPEVEFNQTEEKNVAVIRIKESPIKPVSAKGKSFRKVGNSNRVMPMQEIAEMHYHSTGASWDKLSAKNASMNDIDYVVCTPESGHLIKTH